MADFTDFDFDSFKEEFEENATTVLDKTYKEIFALAKKVCVDGEVCAENGLGKQLAANVDKLVAIASKLVEIERFSKPIVGPTGRKYNIFGQDIISKAKDLNVNNELKPLDDEDDEMRIIQPQEEVITEEEALAELKKILDSIREITIDDLRAKDEEDEMCENDANIGDDMDQYFRR